MVNKKGIFDNDLLSNATCTFCLNKHGSRNSSEYFPFQDILFKRECKVSVICQDSSEIGSIAFTKAY